MKTGRFSQLLFIAQTLVTLAYGQGIGTWSAQTNTTEWNQDLGVTQTRQGCADTPATCLQFVGGVAASFHVKVFLAIKLDATNTAAAASDYSRLSLTAPYLAEVGIDDFVTQYKALFSNTSIQPATVLSTVIGNLKSANPQLKFGGTIYEDELANAYLQDAKLPATIRAKFDYIHLYIHYRENGGNFQTYVQQARQIFPNAHIIAGSYAYDRRYYLPCHPGGQPCTAAEDNDLFVQSIALQADLLHAGIVDSIEFYPGYFGAESQWAGWNNSRECDPSDVPACIANTQGMRYEAETALGPGFSGQLLWEVLTPKGTRPAARFNHSAVMDSAHHRMILFGGTSADSDLNDTWVLTNVNVKGVAPSWTKLATPAPPPPDYYSTGMYDAANNRMILYGGDNGYDVWVLANANGLGGAPSWTQLAPSGQQPNPLSDWQGQVYDPVNNLLIVYDSANIVWVLSNANGLGGAPVWTQLNISNDGPSTRAAFTVGYNPTGSRLILFGGSDGTTDFSEVWLLSNANGVAGAPVWTNVIAQDAPGSPAGRSGHTAVYDPAKDVMTIFGGLGMPSDTWILTAASGLNAHPAWTPVKAIPIAPDQRTNSTTVLDTSNGSLIIFGGLGDDYLGDLWELTNVPYSW